jgi:hypothetical protein
LSNYLTLFQRKKINQIWTIYQICDKLPINEINSINENSPNLVTLAVDPKCDRLEKNGRLSPATGVPGTSLGFSSVFLPTRSIRSGLPDFIGTTYRNEENVYQNTINHTKWLQNIPNGHKIYPMAIKYTQWP